MFRLVRIFHFLGQVDLLLMVYDVIGSRNKYATKSQPKCIGSKWLCNRYIESSSESQHIFVLLWFSVTAHGPLPAKIRVILTVNQTPVLMIVQWLFLVIEQLSI